jgi:hypothetical protein
VHGAKVWTSSASVFEEARLQFLSTEPREHDRFRLGGRRVAPLALQELGAVIRKVAVTPKIASIGIVDIPQCVARVVWCLRVSHLARLFSFYRVKERHLSVDWLQ